MKIDLDLLFSQIEEDNALNTVKKGKILKAIGIIEEAIDFGNYD